MAATAAGTEPPGQSTARATGRHPAAREVPMVSGIGKDEAEKQMDLFARSFKEDDFKA